MPGVDLIVDGGERRNIRNGFEHYSGYPASSTPGQVPTSQRRRLVILDGREGASQWQLLYSSNDYRSQEAAEIRAVIDAVGAGGPQISEFTITVQADPNAGGSVSGGGVFEENRTISLTAAPEEGYRFAEWIGDGVLDPFAATTMARVVADQTMTARFIKTWQVEVTASPVAGGTVSGAGIVDEGSAVMLEASAAEGYRFSHWSGGEVSDPWQASTAAEVNGEQHFIANFVKVWNLEVMASPSAAGIVSGGGVFDESAVVEIVATPAEGYRFQRWTEESASDPFSADSTVTITADTSVTAEFVKVWTLSLASTDPDGGSVSGEGKLLTRVPRCRSRPRPPMVTGLRAGEERA